MKNLIEVFLLFFVLGAVQTKFGLGEAETTTVWLSMIRCIKSRRRNTLAKIRRSNNNNNNNNSKYFVQAGIKISFDLFCKR